MVRTDVRSLVEREALAVENAVTATATDARGNTSEVSVRPVSSEDRERLGRQLLDVLAAKAASRGVHLFTGSVLGENSRALGALAAVFPGIFYEVRDGAYQVRAPLREVVL